MDVRSRHFRNEDAVVYRGDVAGEGWHVSEVLEQSFRPLFGEGGFLVLWGRVVGC